MSSYTPTTIANSNINLEQYTPKSVAETNMELATIGTELQLLSPASEVTGLTSTPTFKWEAFNPSSTRRYQVRVVAKVNKGDIADFTNEVSFITASTTFTVPTAHQLADGWYEWKVRPATLIESDEFEDTFDRTTLGGDYTTETRQGSGSVTLDGSDITIEGDASLTDARQILRLTQTFENPTILLENVVFSDVSEDFHPVIYFNTTGDFMANNQVNGYYLFFFGEQVSLGKVVNSPSNIQNRNFTRVANTTSYNIRLKAINGNIETYMWETGTAEGDALHTHSDPNPYLSGGIDISCFVFSVLGSANMKIGRIFVTYEAVTTTEITGVTITGSTSDLIEGETRQFSASVEGTGNVQQSVDWTATGGTINENGIFTASLGAGSCSVTATATQDNTQSATVNFNRVEEPAPVTGGRADDEAALEAISASLNIGSSLTNWANSNMSLSDSIEGVTTKTVGGELRVDRIDLSDKGIIATSGLPSLINNLTEMEYFNVMRNEISGVLPQIVLPNLIYLYLNHSFDVQSPNEELHDKALGNAGGGRDVHPGKNDQGAKNKFTGELYVDCPNLRWIACSWTNITSVNMSKIFESTGLKGVWIDSNGQLENNEHSIPSSISNSTGLTHLGVGSVKTNNGKNFGGTIPSGMSNLTQLHSFRIARNNFTGALPNFSGCDVMQTFVISFNSFTTGFPAYFIDGSVGNLNAFSVGFIDWQDAELPQTIATSLRSLLVSYCNVTGNIPQMPRQMIITDFANNNFSTITEDWTNLTRIRNIIMNGNPNLSGNIPELDWLTPSRLKDFTRARFGGTGLNAPTGLEDGRLYDHNLSDRGDSGPIVQKTRLEWYQYHCTFGETNKPNSEGQFSFRAP